MGLPVCVPLSLFHTFPSFVATATENLQMLGADAFSALKGTFVCYKCTNLEKVAMVSAFDFALQWYLPWILHCNGTCLGSCIWRVMTACTGLVPSHWDGLVPSHWEIDDSLYWPQTTDRPQTDHRQTTDRPKTVCLRCMFRCGLWPSFFFLLLPSSLLRCMFRLGLWPSFFFCSGRLKADGAVHSYS